jgi:hypothetical protein
VAKGDGFRRVGGALNVLLALFPGTVMALQVPELGSAGKITSIYGSANVEAEDYRYDSAYGARDRTRLRARIDLNGRGFVWDPRFAVFDAGVTLQRENVQSVENNVTGSTSYSMLGYRLNTTWFANKPYPLTLYANRNQSTVSDFWSPSYELTTSNMGARWGMENQWLGRSSFYIDQTSSESNSSQVPRSEQNLSLGMDASQKLLRKQWGESDISYGYRHTAWDELVYGGNQRQDYLYINDRSLFGDKANLSANLTYYDRSDQWGFSGTGSNAMKSKFLAFNSMFNVQQTEDLRHFYGLGLSLNEAGSSQSISHSLSGGVNYRLNERWQVTGTLGLSGSSTEAPVTGVGGSAQKQESTSVSGSAAAMYSNTLGNYLVNGGYNLALMQSDTTGFGLPAQQSTSHSANLGYTRMNSPVYADSLQLRVSQILGEPSGSELNVRYSVNSMLTQRDMLQGVAEYRRYQQKYTLWTSNVNANTLDYYQYGTDSQSTRLDFGWMHRFSEASSLMLSAGATSGVSQDIAIDTRYAQARAAMRLRSALQWTALARAEQIEGLESIAGRKVTIESDLDYRIGKWQATARYRFRDANQAISPFKERSIIFMLKRDYGFRR